MTTKHQPATPLNYQPVHFHSSDDRFCGSRKMARRFTFYEKEVTCERCLCNVRLVLTEQGRETLRQLGYMA